MVTKQSNHSVPPEFDESWWTALLAEEDKYIQTGSKEQIVADEYKEHGSEQVRKLGKTSEIN